MPVILDILSSGPAPISTFNCDFDTDYSQYFHTDVILSCIWSMIQISGHDTYFAFQLLALWPSDDHSADDGAWFWEGGSCPLSSSADG